MKRVLNISVLIFLFMMYACEDKNKVEIIPDYEEIYLDESKVDVAPEIIGDEEKIINSVLKLSEDNFKPIVNAFYMFKTKMYLSERGKLEKIKYSKLNSKKHFPDAVINPNIDDLFNELTKLLRTIEFSPALFNSKKVKPQYTWEAQINVDSTGKGSIFSGSLGMAGLRKLSNIEPKDYFVAVDEMPSPVGGISVIAKNVHYPEIAKRAGIQGRVFVKAFINENGEVVGVEVLKGIGGGCDQAAINAIVATKFNSGKQKGKPVKVQVSIPILFKLN